MPLNHHLVGQPLESSEHSWTTSDVLLYALAVGAGQDDPLAELEFTTENTSGVETKVLPTFGNLIGGTGSVRAIGDFDPAGFVHAEQALTLHRTLPVEGTARSQPMIVGIYDKGHAALVIIESTYVDVATGEPLVTSRASLFVFGEGGFGGERGPSSDWSAPDRPPDHEITYRTRPEQALLYRLTGDRNPLHTDPAFAARGGFGRPILHGMCTYGYTGRALLHAVCGSDPARLTSMAGRFTSPVLPGDALTVAIWVGGRTAAFRTTSNGVTVLDHGRMTFIP
jgi:acyl dehydratase